jgi:hypothetical protein
MRERSDDLAIEAKWTTGQRTPLWDSLWHRILVDITPRGREVESDGAVLPRVQEDHP